MIRSIYWYILYESSLFLNSALVSEDSAALQSFKLFCVFIFTYMACERLFIISCWSHMMCFLENCLGLLQ